MPSYKMMRISIGDRIKYSKTKKNKTGNIKIFEATKHDDTDLYTSVELFYR